MSFPRSIAILGGRGMLGTDLAEACHGRGADVKCYDLPEFDITDRDHCTAALGDCDVVVNCAAYTNVDGAESEATLARNVNATAVGDLGRLAKRAGKRILHISTDFVFDGTLDRPYVETDQPNPIGEYGRSKLAGETLLHQSGCSHAIVRVQWTYGHHGNNFVKKLIERARNSTELKVVDDQVGSPTATVEVAKALCELLDKGVEGLYHFASRGYISRFDLAKAIAERLSLDVVIKPCRTSDVSSPAQRPLNSRFDCEKIVELLKAPMEPWQASLAHFLETR
ncbi:MAG: dTDP-4-dehydrorhamnose reductase [Planctomycetes bacterium]|nr:dTDP-4-dehydrorhamnose reductase [Planctomycetota bacterium]